MMEQIVIIGAGECGTRAAFALREGGFGGGVTLIGREPHLPYERPPLSKPAEDQARLKLICAPDMIESANIAYHQGLSAEWIDPAERVVATSDGSALPYDRVLLATGAKPRGLTCPGAEHALSLRSFADAERIFSRAVDGRPVVIIGAGLIGMEMAAVLRAKGAAVTVVEAGPRVLGRAVPTVFADQLLARHLAEGVEVLVGQGISAITRDGVALADGRTLPAEMVISAIGVSADMQLAADAGLATGNGILVDAQLRSSDSTIFAAGDCAAVQQSAGGHIRFESWRNARSQAEHAAANMLGAGRAFMAVPSFWSDQYDLTLQVAGMPEAQDTVVGRQSSSGQIAFYLRDGRLMAAAGLGVGNSVARDIKLAEMLIAAETYPDATRLADSSFSLKSLLSRANAA
jgi:3-phenylpropionate/trans-cinnamate dioxygenase ferredoxin reductase subunit